MTPFVPTLRSSVLMFLDEGGDETLLINLGKQAETDPSVLDKPENVEEQAAYASIRKRLAEQPGWYSKVAESLKGVTEETTTGVHRLYEMAKKEIGRAHV